MIPLRTLAVLFLRLGATAFGGPAAHIAMLHHEVVRRRGWITDAEFAELIAITNLLPGPNSTEMAIHVGRRMAGWPGLLVAGIAFILPAAVIVLLLAMLYVEQGRTPDVQAIMNGVIPVIIAVIAHASWRLARSSITDSTGWIIAIACGALSLGGANELLLLALAGLAAALSFRLVNAGVLLVTAHELGAQALGPVVAGPVPAAKLFLFFLKIGSVLFGSGYVLIAFLRADLVERWHWLTNQQLLDAIAVGQVTPGPLFTTATFIGYVLGGFGGAVVATVGIFLPAFIFVALAQPLVRALRRSPTARRFLYGVVAASLALMASVAMQLGATALRDPLSIAATIVVFFILLRWQLNSAWLVLAGAILGFVGNMVR